MLAWIIEGEQTLPRFGEVPNLYRGAAARAAYPPRQRTDQAVTAEPLERGLADAAESGQIVADWPAERLEANLTAKFGWDKLAARSFWAFGPEAQGANALLDDTLASEVDKTLLSDVRESVVKGFRWACSGGPLCEEPMRNVKFKILDAMLADTPVYRGRGQLIPTARRVAYSAFLLASPRLMEPFFQVEIQTPPDLVSTCEEVLSRRRGFVRQSVPKPGTPFISMKGYIPAMDSFGFETDLRVSTSGLAFPQTVFSHWEIVPGDPLDRSVKILPLEASSGYSLARDFMLKTRRRKGLSEDVSLKKFFDETKLPLAGKIGATFGTAGYLQGGCEIALQNNVVRMLCKGMLVYSGGCALGEPLTHLGAIALGGHVEEQKEQFITLGERVAAQAARL